MLFHHAPSAQKPSKDATEEELGKYREQLKQKRLNVQALDQMGQLREACPADRHVIFCGDGSYTNAVVIKNLPANCTYIGRIRKDANFCYPAPEVAQGAKVNGRPRCFGPQAPTPEQLRVDETIPWQSVSVFAAGKLHDVPH